MRFEPVRLERAAHVVGVAAVALPAANRQHEIDAVFVGELRQRKAILPAAGPALRHNSDGTAGRAVRAEEADLQFVIVVHRHAAVHGGLGPAVGL